jgi:hypothetical protein
LLAARVNAAAWLEAFAPTAFTLVSAGSIVFYALRRLREPLAPAAWLLLGALLVAACLAAWYKRKAYFGLREASVYLENQLGLNAALSSAHEGIAPWPEIPQRIPRLLRLKSPVLFAWFGACLALLLASLYLPVPAINLQGLKAAEKPPALAEVESLLEEIKQSDIADRAALERLAEEARQLGNRPSDQQYTHSALEAADALKDQTLAATQNLAKNFEAAAAALDEVEKQGNQLSDAEAKQAAKELNAALQGLRDGQMPANQKLSSQLKGMDGSKLRQMNQKQLSQMKQSLSKAGNQARGISGSKSSTQIAKGNGQKIEVKMGQGGEGGSGNSAPIPLAFNENPSAEKEGKTDAIGSEDFSRATLGDTLKTTSGLHRVDPNAKPVPQAGGAISAPALGGEAVWVSKLTPEERAALKDFYK